MRDWSSSKTAKWWRDADSRYERRNENLPSKEYFDKHFSFDSVLEIGSGTGRLINYLPASRKGALDINPHLLQLVSPDIEKYNYDISLGHPDVKYDLVFTFQVLQHLDHKKFIKALKNIKAIANQEMWLIEGVVEGWPDGSLTHQSGSYNHHYEKYIKPYQIDGLHGNKIKVYRVKL